MKLGSLNSKKLVAGHLFASYWMKGAVTLLYLVVTLAAFGQEPPRQQDDDSLTYSPRTITGTLEVIGSDDLRALTPLEEKIGRNEFAEVLPDLTRYVKEHPDSPRGHYDLGYLYFRTHQVGDSIRELSRSLQLNVNDAAAHKTLGLACTFVGRYDLAELELQSAIKLEPNSPELHYLLGRAYFTRGVYPLAQKEFETAIRLSPAYMKAYTNLGLVMEILGKNDAAVENYTTAARLNEEQKQNYPWPFEYLSAYYDRQREPERAIVYAEKALALDPNFDVAWFQMAKAYQYQSKWKECAEAAQKAISINQRTADYYYVLSVALRRQGLSAESEAALKKFQAIREQEQVDSAKVKKAREQSMKSPTGNPPNEP
jgi:tetratricopeptide (TPR) repeat protein